MSGVNTLFNALVNPPEFAALDFSALRVTIGGGAAVQSEVARRWRDITGSDAGRRLRPDRGLAGGVHQSDPRAEDRHRRPAGAVDRSDHPRRRWRHPRSRARPAKSGCAARRSCRAIGSGPTKPGACSPPTAGCAPATSALSTRRASCNCSTARRTWSSSPASRSFPTRSRTSPCTIRACSKPRRSACRTSAPVRR